jgi:hypothetical protein
MRLVLTFTLLLVACSDDPAAPAVDATGGGDSGGDEARCLVKADHGDLGTLTGATGAGMSPTSLTITLDAGPPRDSFFINLKNGLAAGTYAIQGAEADATTCSLCVNLIADIVAMQGPTKFYFATAGSVTLTATQPPAGTLTNVTFVETSVAGEPLDSGCTSRIGAMSFGPT